MSKDFLTVISERRSYYNISKDSPISDDRIFEIIEHAVKYTPSSMNAQSGRVVLLLGAHHDRFWKITMEALRKIVPAEQFGKTEDKINSFAMGHGTVLFFEDQDTVSALQEQYSLYKDNFPTWSQQSSGMCQLIVWAALENEGLGASLQHYTELIEEDVKKEWGILSQWKLIAQMPFGKPTAAPFDKDFMPLEARVKLYK